MKQKTLRLQKKILNDTEILVFETVGVAAQDLVAAKKIYDKAAACGIGTVWESGN